ncbi:hypothetical protein ACS0TY_005694 [Phlomoides rotata]
MSSELTRKGKGRQKVEMVKIGNETNLQVTFSKRRAGLFKKASELSTLCGAETTVVVFSPGNKAHCFGHPTVDAVANRFLNQGGGVAPMSDADKLLQAHQKTTVNQQNQELTHIQRELEHEQKRSRALEKERKEAMRLPEMDKLNYRQLEQLQVALLRLKRQLQAKVDNAADQRAIIPYDPTAATESCPLIPYSADASNEH